MLKNAELRFKAWEEGFEKDHPDWFVAWKIFKWIAKNCIVPAIFGIWVTGAYTNLPWGKCMKIIMLITAMLILIFSFYWDFKVSGKRVFHSWWLVLVVLLSFVFRVYYFEPRANEKALNASLDAIQAPLQVKTVPAPQAPPQSEMAQAIKPGAETSTEKQYDTFPIETPNTNDASAVYAQVTQRKNEQDRQNYLYVDTYQQKDWTNELPYFKRILYILRDSLIANAKKDDTIKQSAEYFDSLPSHIYPDQNNFPFATIGLQNETNLFFTLSTDAWSTGEHRHLIISGSNCVLMFNVNWVGKLNSVLSVKQPPIDNDDISCDINQSDGLISSRIKQLIAFQSSYSVTNSPQK